MTGLTIIFTSDSIPTTMSDSQIIWASSNTNPMNIDPNSILSKHDSHGILNEIFFQDQLSIQQPQIIPNTTNTTETSSQPTSDTSQPTLASSEDNSNSTDTSTPSIDFYFIHGIMLFVGWSIFVPIGILTVVYHNKNWMKYHKRFIFYGIFISACGIIAALIGKYNDDTTLIITFGNDIVSDVHVIIGITVTLASLLQVSLGYYIDKTFNQYRIKIPIRDRLHW